MKRDDVIKRYAAGERDFRGLDFGNLDLHSINLSGVNLSNADMQYVNLCGAILKEANFLRTDLYGAKLNGANLYKADLHHARLDCASFYRANLSETDLRETTLHEAILHGTNLRRALLCDSDLREASLLGADLREARLERTKLAGCDFTDANLRGTCLSDTPGCSPSDLLNKDWDVRDGYVYGWRTDWSIHVGKTHYKPGQVYTAPTLSCSKETGCHPGIYMVRTAKNAISIKSASPLAVSIVRVRARCEDVVLLDAWQTKGIRTRRLEVL